MCLGERKRKGGSEDEKMVTKDEDEAKRMDRKRGGRKGGRGEGICSNVYFLSRRLMFNYRQNN